MPKKNPKKGKTYSTPTIEFWVGEALEGGGPSRTFEREGLEAAGTK